MKKTIFILVVVFLLAIGLVNATSISEEADVRIDMVSYSPSPVYKGEEVTILFKIKNIGDIELKNLRFSVTEKFPFSLAEGETGTQTIALMPNEEKQINFSVKVSENALTGNNKLTIQYYSEKLMKTISAGFNINVLERSKVIGLNLVETIPGRMIPGDTGKLLLTLNNDGTYTITDVEIKLDLKSLPLTVIGSTSERKIRSLAPAQSKTLSFNLIVDSDAESKAYKVPITMTYYDKLGTKTTKNDTLGVIVDYQPEYIINIDDTEVFTRGATGNLVISISNIGPSKIKYLTVELEESKDYDVVGKNIDYIGNVDSDDFETAEFKMHLKSGKSTVPINLILTYKDAFNNEYVKKEILDLPTYSKAEASSYGLKVQQTNMTAIWILILLVLIYVGYKEWKKTRDLGKAVKNTLRKSIKAVFRFALWLIGLIWPPNLIREIRKFMKFLKQ